jgi:hypothetical protein
VTSCGQTVLYSLTGRPGLLIVPGWQYQVMISMTRRPAALSVVTDC